MSRLTMRTMRDVILDLIDQYKPSQSRFDPRLVEVEIIIARNLLRKNNANREAARRGDIAPDWFTRRELDIEFGSMGAYVALPNGAVSLPDDQGVRVSATEGLGNPFVRFPLGWCRNYPQLAFAEGNVPWELDRGIVRFPALNRGNCYYTKVAVDVIEDAVAVDLDEPLAMPSDYQYAVQQMVLQALGVAQPEDRRADSKPVNAT